MKILVALDGSKDAAEGVRMTLHMAKGQGGDVTLLAVVPLYPDIDLEISARAQRTIPGGGDDSQDHADQFGIHSR
jgi:hypothetical protein